MRKWMITIMLLLLNVTLVASDTSCKTVEHGPPGPPGATGSTGPTGHMGGTGSTGATGASNNNQHFYIDSNGNSQTVPNGSSVVFSGSPISTGTAFSFTSPGTTINITQSGDYLVNFVAYADMAGPNTVYNGFQVKVNNTFVGQPTNSLFVDVTPAPLPLTLIIRVTGASPSTPVPVQVVNVTHDSFQGIQVFEAMIDLVQLTTF